MKTELIKFRVSPEVKETFQEAAELSGLPMSAWIRERLIRAIIQELEEADRPIRFLQKDRN